MQEIVIFVLPDRVDLAKLLKAGGNVLLLDEPTNDLDMATLELLEEAVDSFNGTILLISHDRTFMDNVVTSTWVFDTDVDGNGIVKEYVGGYQDYLEQKAREDKAQAAKQPKMEKVEKADKPKAAPIEASTTTTPAPAAKKKLSYKEQRELEALPEEIAALESEQAELNTQLSNPEVFKDYEKAALLQTRAEEIEMQLLEKLERWEMLENKQNSTG